MERFIYHAINGTSWLEVSKKRLTTLGELDISPTLESPDGQTLFINNRWDVQKVLAACKAADISCEMITSDGLYSNEQVLFAFFHHEQPANNCYVH